MNVCVLLVGMLSMSTTDPNAVVGEDSVYVLQNRSHPRAGRFEVSLEGFSSVSGRFVDHFGAIATGRYHVRERLGFAFMTSLPFSVRRRFTSLARDIFEQEQGSPEPVDLKWMRYFNAMMVEVSPFYGKLRSGGEHLEFDLSLGVGVGFVSTGELCDPEELDCSEVVALGQGARVPRLDGDTVRASAAFSLGFRLSLFEMIALRSGLTQLVYPDRVVESRITTSAIRNHLLFSLGVSLFL